jgi:hypothetical protein
MEEGGGNRNGAAAEMTRRGALQHRKNRRTGLACECERLANRPETTKQTETKGEKSRCAVADAHGKRQTALDGIGRRTDADVYHARTKDHRTAVAPATGDE